MIKLYTGPNCPYCFSLKEFLKEQNVKFQEIDASKDEKIQEELIKKTGKMEVPVLEKDGQMIVGFNRQKICQLLHIKG